jgi:preprotein translocase subunit SecF
MQEKKAKDLRNFFIKSSIILLLFIFLISDVFALDVDFSCPNEVEISKEFECMIKISDTENNYDLKIDILENSERIAKIWNEESWSSTYYFIKDFISPDEEKQVKLKIEKDFEKAQGTLRLRKTGSSSFSYEEEFEIDLKEREENNGGEDNEEDKNIEESNKNNEEEDSDDVASEDNKASQTKNIINLNPQNISNQEVIYESKNEKIKKYAIYAFSLFLILIIIFLLIRK